ncbi:MAG: hypothetical protein ACYS47_05880 [Planctomycetota bacterium]|jgi:hypothetical protein
MRNGLAILASLACLALSSGCLSLGASSRLSAIEERLVAVEKTVNEMYNYTSPEVRDLENRILGLKRDKELARMGIQKGGMTAPEIDELLVKLQDRLREIKK